MMHSYSWEKLALQPCSECVTIELLLFLEHDKSCYVGSDLGHVFGVNCFEWLFLYLFFTSFSCYHFHTYSCTHTAQITPTGNVMSWEFMLDKNTF